MGVYDVFRFALYSQEKKNWDSNVGNNQKNSSNNKNSL
jgi:hypothetical protein